LRGRAALARGAGAAAALAALALVSGCRSAPKPDEGSIRVAPLPAHTGGIAAAQAVGALPVSFETAAVRIGAWSDLVEAQSGTVYARQIRSDDDPAAVLREACAKAGTAPDAAVAALAAWQQGAPARFRETHALLDEAWKHTPPGIGVLAGDPGSALGVTVFTSGSRTILALADLRRGAAETEAWLVEIHFHVSGQYVAGMNVYHLAAGAPPVLTVQLYTWIRQVEGVFGAFARGMAERELGAQAEATWREVATYLQR
jgi:hypothetical protein